MGGSHADLVSLDGVTTLTNGNYVVSSPQWDNGSVFEAGAVTWGNGTGGTTGVVSASNSLVGSTLNNQVGDDYYGEVTALTNGNYLVLNSVWDNGSVVDAGAVTWGNGTGGTAGVVSASNSLVGSTANDQVGDDFWGRVIELTNGNYVVISPSWDLEQFPIVCTHSQLWMALVNCLIWAYLCVHSNGICSRWNTPGRVGCHLGQRINRVAGPISASNSLVGTSKNAHVGNIFLDNRGVTALTNGNYVVHSSNAVTWGNESSGVTGTVSASNSLVGTGAPFVSGEVIALANGNYVVSTPTWSYETPGPYNLGAVTWGNGTTGTTGAVSTTNTLVGVNTYDSVGDGGLVALTNGNYVVISTGLWSGMGTVTWVNGSHVTTGVVSAANSLVGSAADDQVGSGLYGGGVIALTNSNYVVISPYWDNGNITDAGSIIWGNGTSGTTGVVSASNSLVGSTADDQVGGDWWDGGVIVLPNGNYVVSIPQWDNGNIVDAGAVTWENGTGGTTGPVSASNSLVGSTMGAKVGDGSFSGAAGVTALTNGNYIVNSPDWSSVTGVGAVTWGNGTSGTAGAVSAANSLVNTCANDQGLCRSTITTLPDGNVSMRFPNWSNGSNNGAVSLIACDPNITVGPVGAANSVLGTTANKGFSMISGYDAVNTQLIVGRPWDNRVTILRCQAGPTYWLYLPVVIK